MIDTLLVVARLPRGMRKALPWPLWPALAVTVTSLGRHSRRLVGFHFHSSLLHSSLATLQAGPAWRLERQQTPLCRRGYTTQLASRSTRESGSPRKQQAKVSLAHYHVYSTTSTDSRQGWTMRRLHQMPARASSSSTCRPNCAAGSIECT